MNSRQCPAMFVAAPASGQGKTTVTAALARWHRNAGRRVRVFKTGPDFLDPMILEHASSAPVYQLDLFMAGENHCRALLYEAAQEADLILVEGVMGLFDGQPSGAELAERFGLPVLAVINATAMAQTFAAVAFGLMHFRPQLPCAGVFANQVASEGHCQLLRNSLPSDLPWYGALFRDDALVLPSRHLGLVSASEVTDLELRIEALAAGLSRSMKPVLPPPVTFNPVEHRTDIKASSLERTTIAIARDAAFAFLYRANIDCLTQLGAKLVYFSPLAGDTLPDCDSVYLPGGYPELHLQTLADNKALKAALHNHVQTGKPMLAECGGMLYLLDSLTATDGESAELAAVLPGTARLQRRLANLGLHAVTLPEGELRAHTFHHSITETSQEPVAFSSGKRGNPEPVYRWHRVTASYLHFYFPSNPDAIARLFTL